MLLPMLTLYYCHRTVVADTAKSSHTTRKRARPHTNSISASFGWYDKQKNSNRNEREQTNEKTFGENFVCTSFSGISSRSEMAVGRWTGRAFFSLPITRHTMLSVVRLHHHPSTACDSIALFYANSSNEIHIFYSSLLFPLLLSRRCRSFPVEQTMNGVVYFIQSSRMRNERKANRLKSWDAANEG